MRVHDRARRLAHPHPAPGRPAPNLKAAAFPRLRGRCAQRPTACVRLAPTAPPREPRAANRVEPPTSSTQITCRTHLQLACSCGAHTHGALCTIRRHLAAVFPLLTPVLLPGTPYKLLPGTPRPPRMTALGARHRRVPRRDGVSHATTVRTVSPTPPRPRRDKTLAWGRKTSSRPRAPCAQHLTACAHSITRGAESCQHPTNRQRGQREIRAGRTTTRRIRAARPLTPLRTRYGSTSPPFSHSLRPPAKMSGGATLPATLLPLAATEATAPPGGAAKKKKKGRKRVRCGHCGASGHTVRSCEVRKLQERTRDITVAVPWRWQICVGCRY